MNQTHHSHYEKLSAIVASVFGVGFLPIAPGTWGSLFCCILFGLVFIFENTIINWFLILAAFHLLGFACCSRAELIFNKKDASYIVIDECAGQSIALLPLLFFTNLPLLFIIIGIIASFLLFRFFDIVKPFGINELQRLKNGVGVMADDILAGIYTAVIMTIFCILSANLI